MRSRSPLWWVSLEPELSVLWKHGSAKLGFRLRSNGRWANARARGTPRLVPQLRQGGRMQMSQTRRHKANHCATYPGPRTEWQHANSQFWNGWGAGCSTSGQRLGGKPEVWSSTKTEVPVSLWILPVLASNPAFGRKWEEGWNERRRRRRRTGKDESGKVGQTPTLQQNPKCGRSCLMQSEESP